MIYFEKTINAYKLRISLYLFRETVHLSSFPHGFASSLLLPHEKTLFLFRTGAGGFNLEYITKLATVKDTASKKSLLHHIVKKVYPLCKRTVPWDFCQFLRDSLSVGKTRELIACEIVNTEYIGGVGGAGGVLRDHFFLNFCIWLDSMLT